MKPQSIHCKKKPKVYQQKTKLNYRFNVRTISLFNYTRKAVTVSVTLHCMKAVILLRKQSRPWDFEKHCVITYLAKT